MTRVAIIGAGIGAEHLAAYAELPELFEVATVCDLNLARAEAVASRHGIPATADFDAVLASDVDLIDVCLPPDLHLSACLGTPRRARSRPRSPGPVRPRPRGR